MANENKKKNMNNFAQQIEFHKVSDVAEELLKEKNIPEYYYSFGELYDDSYCVIIDGDYFTLLYYERGSKREIIKDSSIEKVCARLIKEISPERKKEEFVAEFYNRCHKRSSLEELINKGPKPPCVSKDYYLDLGSIQEKDNEEITVKRTPSGIDITIPMKNIHQRKK